MWIFVIISFTRYTKVGRAAEREFERDLKNDGFYHLHSNLFIRYCTSPGNATIHKERVKKIIPNALCDVSVIMIPDSQEQNIYHCLKRKHSKKTIYEKPSPVEFF